ncbi:MAG TPA: DUF1587 domain-containing protein, partial [Polyangiaceae bacterium]|nr:DUF1587 domain-containing protein [Polyangiaceae bacterium]
MAKIVDRAFDAVHTPPVRLQLSRLAHHHGCLVVLAVAACTGSIGAPGSLGATGSPGGSSGPGGPDGSTAQALVCNGAADTGAAPLERLTRGQYGNVVRDLLGLKTAFDVTSLGEDEKVGPFASNEVAPVSELTLEQYTEAAEALATSAGPG